MLNSQAGAIGRKVSASEVPVHLATNRHNHLAKRARTSQGSQFLRVTTQAAVNPNQSILSQRFAEVCARGTVSESRFGNEFTTTSRRISEARRTLNISSIEQQRSSQSPQSGRPMTAQTSKKLQRNEAPPCAKGCKSGSTRMCPFCAKVVCWICAKEEVQPLCRLRPCEDCIVADALHEEADDIEDYELAKASILKGAAKRSFDGAVRPRTGAKRANAVSAFASWARESEGRSGIGIDKAPSALLLERFVRARFTGEPLACPLGPVCEATIKSSFTAIRKWIKSMNDSCGAALTDHTYDPCVQAALREAKDLGPVPNNRKAPVEEERYLRTYDRLAHPELHFPNEDPFLMHSYFIATSSIFFLLPRRTCFAKRHWDPAYLVRDMKNPASQAQLGQDTQPWKWGIDAAGHGWVRALIGLEKNQPQQMLTTRWSTDAHFLNRHVAEDLHRAFSKLNMPAGPTLRRSAESLEPWTSADWAAYLNFLASELGMPRSSLGTTSLRRGYATCLREHGVSPKFIRMLGYWRSDAGNDYDGAAMVVRLGCQKAVGPKSFSAVSHEQLSLIKDTRVLAAVPRTPSQFRQTVPVTPSSVESIKGRPRFVRVDTGAALKF